MPGYVRTSGTWRTIGQGAIAPFVRVSGVWRKVNNAYVKTSGTWRQWYFNDHTGPGVPINYYSDFVSGGQCRAVWTTPSDADFSYMHVECYLSGTSPGSGSPVFTANVSGVPSTTYNAINNLNNPYYNIQTWYLTPYDTNGNAGTTVAMASCGFTGSARGRAPSPIQFDPVESATYSTVGDGWASAGVRTDASGVAIGGQRFDGSVQRDYAGLLYYGTQFYDYLRGANITSAYFTIYVGSTNGQSDYRVLETRLMNHVSGNNPVPSFTGPNGSSEFVPSGQLGNRTSSSVAAGDAIANANYDSTVLPYFASYPANYRAVMVWDALKASIRHPSTDDDFCQIAIGAAYLDFVGARVTITHDG